MRPTLGLLLVVACVEAKWWMDQPYDNTDFNARVEYGDNYNLTCEDERLEGLPYDVLYWVIPDMTIMRGGDYLDFKTLDGQAGWQVSNDANFINLFIVTEYHFGFYYCLVEQGGEEIMVKRAVNYQGPYFDDLWDDYRLNTIVGCSAALIFLGIVGIFYGTSVWFEKRSGNKSTIEPEVQEYDLNGLKQGKLEEGEGTTNVAYAPEIKEKIVDQEPIRATENAITGF